MELTKIRGINEKREQEFNKLGIFDTADLVRYFPRAYLDLREKQLLKYAYHNDVVLTVGKIVSVPTTRYYRRGGMVKAVCEQEGFVFSVVWFNQPYVASKLVVGEEYLFYGRVQSKIGEVSLVNPSFELCEKAFRLKGIVPQYTLKGSLNQKVVRDAVRLSVDIEKPQSIIPRELQVKYDLSDLYAAYREVHNPTSFDAQKKGAERIAVEEYFALISAFKFIKGGREQVRINDYNCQATELLQFIKQRFPFEFTDGQKQAVNEIFSDMSGKKVMNRLMQGDVGSGKTAVGMCAIFIAVNSGYQAVMLAPTEVLARQNYLAVKRAFPEYNVDILTGSMTAKEKREVKSALKDGYINILVGTHALLEEDVEFKKLSLCVCDEQQRFGVAQRSSLLSKGVAPDVLVMSATPIPRTLSLIFYGDLDITTIKDKPKARIEIQTNIVPTEKYNDMLGFIEREIFSGRQAYFVCPKIEGDEEGAVISATELYEELKEKMPNVKVGLLHGKMKDKEKNSIMQSFKDKQIDFLVSTTVIEVGVDVPDASVMVIYNAERFGLSQLHQLRGRVGRSDKKSYCFLLTKLKEGLGLERLKILKDNSDGFKISEYDYKIRGAGDFMGDKQSGKFMSELGSLNYSTESIFLAKKISDEAFESGYPLASIKEVAIKKYNKLKDIAMN
ncbi:MAG: ATP-dependent DNA helicase RecG [Clostridiales bacterium]|nr:ATP-dependent DNA helicase RecG [Clostridiales bacterium]